ncbi:MAG: hypothetical protein AAFQ44_08420 [Pseudomonadota bacterium]
MFNPFAAFASPKLMQSTDIFELWDDAHPRVPRTHVAVGGAVFKPEQLQDQAPDEVQDGAQDRASRDHLDLQPESTNDAWNTRSAETATNTAETTKRAA